MTCLFVSGRGQRGRWVRPSLEGEGLVVGCGGFGGGCGAVGVVVGDGIGGADPGCVEDVAQRGGAGGKTLVDEGLAGGGAGAGEGSGLLELVGLFYERVGVAEGGKIVVEEVAEESGLGGDERGDVGGLDGGGDEGALELGVDVVLGGVAVGVGADPAV